MDLLDAWIWGFLSFLLSFYFFSLASRSISFLLTFLRSQAKLYLYLLKIQRDLLNVYLFFLHRAMDLLFSLSSCGY